VRVFNPSGTQVAFNDDAAGSLDSFVTYTVPTSGTYYVGISSYGNSSYSATTAGTGRAGQTTGTYAAKFSVAVPALPAPTADIIDVSAGQTSTEARPVYGRMFQTPFSDRIRNEAGIATMAVGNIFEADHVNSILMAGRADLVCLARPHLADPYWLLHAGAAIGDRHEAWPAPYRAGRDQFWRLSDKAQQVEEVRV
jgi:anthraniloyl-CoA monooxygenase